MDLQREYTVCRLVDMGKPQCEGAGLSVHFGESLENYSGIPVLHHMLTSQCAAYMAQQCPHEQPDEITQ